MERLTPGASVFAGSGYLEGKELQNLIQELQQARKKAGLVGSSCKDRKGFSTLKYRYSNIFIKSQQAQIVFREGKHLLTEKGEKERLSRLREGKKERGKRNRGRDGETDRGYFLTGKTANLKPVGSSTASVPAQR